MGGADCSAPRRVGAICARAAYKKYQNIDRNIRSTVTVAYITYNIYIVYIYIYRENVALKSQVWGSLTLAQLGNVFEFLKCR